MKKDKLVSLQPGRKNDDVCHNSLTIGQEGHFSHLLLHCDEVNHWGSGTTLTHICRRNAQDRKKRSDVDCPIWPPTWRSCRRAGRSFFIHCRHHVPGRTGSHLCCGQPSCPVALDIFLLSPLSSLCGGETSAHTDARLATYHDLSTASDLAGNHLPLGDSVTTFSSASSAVSVFQVWPELCRTSSEKG
jgi:hypothetical protein